MLNKRKIEHYRRLEAEKGGKGSEEGKKNNLQNRKLKIFNYPLFCKYKLDVHFCRN